MDAWVYHTAGRRLEADALVAELRASRQFEFVRPANSRYYKGEIHKGDVVYHDGSRRDLVWAHEREGVDVRQFTGQEMDVESRAPTVPAVPPILEPKVERREATPEAAGVPAEGDAVVQSGMWFTAYRNGQKVGKAQRSEDEAWALLGGRPRAGSAS